MRKIKFLILDNMRTLDLNTLAEGPDIIVAFIHIFHKNSLISFNFSKSPMSFIYEKAVLF